MSADGEKPKTYGAIVLFSAEEARAGFKAFVQEEIWLKLHASDELTENDSIVVWRSKDDNLPRWPEWETQPDIYTHERYTQGISLLDIDALRKFATQHAAFRECGPCALLAGDAREYALQRTRIRSYVSATVDNVLLTMNARFKRVEGEPERARRLVISLDIPVTENDAEHVLFVTARVGWALPPVSENQPVPVQSEAVAVV